jgi:glyoxylase-like metal-dependent hydrolase (beta-lactamase superfamily II)
MIEVLIEGIHTNHSGDGFYDVDPLTSSVSLIQNGGSNILIDTGTPKFRPMIFEKLSQHHLKPKDIHCIFNTHFHLDHCGNDAFFPNATVWVGRSNHDYKTGRARVFTNLDLIEYPAGIKPLFTPGHTHDHTAYLYEENGVRYIFGGDAVREDTIRSQRIPRVHAPEKFLASLKLVFESGDVIVPGHGRVIKGDFKKELYKLVCGEWSGRIGEP